MFLALIIAFITLQQSRGDSVCIDKNASVLTGGSSDGNCDGMVYMNTELFHIGMNVNASMGINTLAPLPNDLGYILGITRLYNKTNEYGYYHKYSGDYIFDNFYQRWSTTIEFFHYSIEGWLMQWSDSNSTIHQRYNWYYNKFINDPITKVVGIPTSKMSITSTASTESIIWLSIDDQVSIRTILTIDHCTHYMKFTVSIKNIAEEALHNVTYNRIFDADLSTFHFYELNSVTDDMIVAWYKTYNYVKYQANNSMRGDSILDKFVRSIEPRESLVWATSQEMDKHIGIGTINSHGKVGFCPFVDPMTAYSEFISLCSDTYWQLYGGVTVDNNDLEHMSHTDVILYLSMLYPVMQPGEIYTFSYYYLLNVTEEEVVVSDTTSLIIAQPSEIITGSEGLVVIYSIHQLNSMELLLFGAANTWESIGKYTFEAKDGELTSAFNANKTYYCYSVSVDSTQYSDESNVHMKAVAFDDENKQLTAHKSVSISNTGRSTCADRYLDFSVGSSVSVSLASCDNTDDATIKSVKYYRELFVDGVEVTSKYIGASSAYPYEVNVTVDDLLPLITSDNPYRTYVKAVISSEINHTEYETVVVFIGYLNNSPMYESSAESVATIPFIYYVIAGLSSAVVLATIAYGYKLYNPLNLKPEARPAEVPKLARKSGPEEVPELAYEMYGYNSSFKFSSNHTSNTTSPTSSPSNSIKKSTLPTLDASKQMDEDICFEFDTIYPANEHFL